MDEKDGLILGIDLTENVSQVSYYNEQLNTPQAAASENGTVMIPNPVKLSQCFAEEDTDEHMKELVSLLASLIEYGKRAAGRIRIAQICICMEDFQIDNLKKVTAAMEKLQFPRNQYELISRQESFAYYAYCQKKELYAAGTVLLDLNESGLFTYRLSSGRKNGIDYIYEERKDFAEASLKQAGEKAISIDAVSDQLCGIITDIMTGKTASSIYLTGPGFDYDRLPDSLTKVICNRRKAFAGQNLYVKGACFAAKEKYEPKVFDHIVLDCEERIPYGIETDILERGQVRRLRIVRPGTNWYAAERQLDFILEDERKITFYLTDCNGVVSEEIADISQIPFRAGKMTRIGISVRFTAADRCVITIKDKGFGQFVKSSGKVFDLEVNLSEIKTRE